MDITRIVDLAKASGRLDSDRQWELADLLVVLTDTQVTEVAIAAGRNDSTLQQYKRAAERWNPNDRVTGVSFSAHRVALSWHDPKQLLIDLKHQHGSPTVQQVRQAMGLEGHPAIELIERGIKKIDRDLSAKALARAIHTLEAKLTELEGIPSQAPDTQAVLEDTSDIEVIEEATEVIEEAPEPAVTGKWVPPLRTADISGI